MKHRIVVTIGALLSGASLTVVSAEPLKLLTTECEEALALSALPERLRENVTVYVLGKTGFEKSRAGTGPFACIANRNHPDSIIPMCFDKPGTAAVLPSEFRRGEMIQAGLTNADYIADRTRRVGTGDVKAPTPGVSYMVSDYNYIYIGPMDRVIKIPAHMMYYGPNMADDDIGGSLQDSFVNIGMPAMNDPGVHGMIVSLVAQASDSSDVVQYCANQLPAKPPSFADVTATAHPEG